MSSQVEIGARGQEDAHLSFKPTKSAFLRQWDRLAIFTTRWLQAPLLGSANYGNTLHSGVSVSADLAMDNYCRIQLGAASVTKADGTTAVTVRRYVDAIGHYIFENVEWRAGNRALDEFTGEMMEIWHEYTEPNDKAEIANRLIGKSMSELELINWGSAQRYYYTQFPVWWSRHIENALPLGGMAWTDPEWKIKLQTRANCAPLDSYAGTFDAIVMYTRYVFVDVPERTFISRAKKQEFVVDQFQALPDKEVSSGTTSVQLEFQQISHPVTAIYWVIQDAAHKTNQDWFRYDAGASGFAGTDALATAEIKIGTQQILEHTEPLFYRIIMPRRVHTRLPRRFVYMYPFAIDCETWKPANSVNFSHLSALTINLVLQNLSAGATVRTFCRNKQLFVTQKNNAGTRFT